MRTSSAASWWWVVLGHQLLLRQQHTLLQLLNICHDVLEGELGSLVHVLGFALKPLGPYLSLTTSTNDDCTSLVTRLGGYSGCLARKFEPVGGTLLHAVHVVPEGQNYLQDLPELLSFWYFWRRGDGLYPRLDGVREVKEGRHEDIISSLGNRSTWTTWT